jgi:hypothetical protein
MPADGSDAAAKKFGTSARPGGSSPRQWMDYTPGVRASEETNQNKPGAVASVVGTFETRRRTPKCLLIEVDQKGPAEGQSDASEPKRLFRQCDCRASIRLRSHGRCRPNSKCGFRVRRPRLLTARSQMAVPLAAGSLASNWESVLKIYSMSLLAGVAIGAIACRTVDSCLGPNSRRSRPFPVTKIQGSVQPH